MKNVLKKQHLASLFDKDEQALLQQEEKRHVQHLETGKNSFKNL
jgi:hypothetical protein